jgi:hypothetical protein
MAGWTFSRSTKVLLGVASMSGVTAGAVMIRGFAQLGGTCEHPFRESAFCCEAQPAPARQSPAAINPANAQTDTPAPTPACRIVDFLSTPQLSPRPSPSVATSHCRYDSVSTSIA